MKVSFVIPVFNAGTFLTEAIHSIRANSVKELEFEILLIDDCSTDPITEELLSKYGRQEEIHVLRQSKNGKVRGDLIVDLLRGKHTDEVAQQQFRIAVEWGRYGELFDYDSDDDTLSLDEGGQ